MSLPPVDTGDDLMEGAGGHLMESTEGLRVSRPDLSSARTLDRRQRRTLAGLGALLASALLLWPMATLTGLTGMATAVYLAAFVYRLLLLSHSLQTSHVITVTDDEARAVPDDDLPVYTILVPAFREPEVIGRLLAALETLEYPAHRLDIKLLLEEDDDETVAAAVRATPGTNVELVLVPAGEPRTKPKACNYGLFLARGEFVTIYDAEDRPEPLQLRKAVVALRRLDPSVACVQAELSYFNPTQNIITKWFTIEYAMWFRQLLPGLVATGAPLPLGGTSNHFRRQALEDLGAWDAYNVTEDADLGIRLHRSGYRVKVLGSTTYEEANSDFVNWVKQRSRWYKGYLQTWLVHLRQPRRLWRELGPSGFLGFNLFVGGTPLLALLNPVFWFLTALWFLVEPQFLLDLLPAPVYHVGLLCWSVGNFAIVYMNVIAARMAAAPHLLIAALLSPVYWVMMSIAAVKAALQLLLKPSFWEKTSHGLGDHRTPDEAAPAEMAA